MRRISLLCLVIAAGCATPATYEEPDARDGGADVSGPTDGPLEVTGGPDAADGPVEAAAIADTSLETLGDSQAESPGNCPRPSSSNLVENPGFETSVWPLADKDRGAGPRLPRWSPEDSTPGCSASGSMVVNDRTAFSPPMRIGPPGSTYYWGFRAKLTRPADRFTPGCEVHFCADEPCLLFISREPIQVTSTEWQPYLSAGTLTVPSPDPPQPIPYARIACFGYQETNGPDVHYDRFFFSAQPISF